jgi:membrane associated rhomboid family serine protease
VVTGGFLHAGFIHLLLNMYVLYIAGSILEPGIGTPRFLGIYFVGLLAGAMGALLVDPNATTVGASGAIFGLMAAVIVVARGRGSRRSHRSSPCSWSSTSSSPSRSPGSRSADTSAG